MARAQPLLGTDLGLDADRRARELPLLEAASRGKGDAFAALVRPHLEMMYRLAARLCADRYLAEDAVQDALSVASRDLGRYRAGSSLRAWLAAIVVRQAHTLVRAARRRQLREHDSPDRRVPASPEELVGAAHAARRVLRALESMPDKRREAVLLRLDAGLSYADIAAAIDSTEGSVRVLVHYGLAELRERLQDLVDEGDSLDNKANQPDSGECP